MGTRKHRVARYAYAVDAGSGFGRLTLWDDAGCAVGEIGFVDEHRPLPGPKLANDLSHGVGFLPASRMLTLVDMLRNEQPVYLTLCDEAPGFVSLHTSG